MAFCSNCGNQLTGNEKFCAQCGTVVRSKPSPASEAAATPAATASASGSVFAAPSPSATVVPPAAPPPAPPQPVAATHLPPGAPVHYVPPGQVPIGVPMPPPPQPANKNGMLGTIIIVVLVAGIGYYFYNKAHTIAGTPQANNPPSQQQPQPQPQNPPIPAPTGGGNSGNAALLQAQQLDAQWQSANGFIVVNAKWTNSSSVNLASAVMECDQYDTGGTDLSQFRMTLNGPTPPQTWSSYSNMQMGEAATGVNKLVCNLVHVNPTN